MLLFLGVVFACTNDQVSVEKEDRPYELFTTKCGSDTTLISASGIKISIQSQSFSCANEGDEVLIKLLPVLSKADMIKYQAYTIDENGAILESGGMFEIEFEGPEEFSINKGVQVSVPASYYNKDMQVFRADHSPSAWKLTDQELRNSAGENIERGKKLFVQHCLRCHSNNFRQTLTGPALGNVTKFRELDWLIRFTKNSQQMIFDRDALAICIWNHWKPTIMNSFDFLTDMEIEQIYEYIENESTKQGIGDNETDYFTNCKIILPDESSFQTSIVSHYIIAVSYTHLTLPTLCSFEC